MSARLKNSNTKIVLTQYFDVSLTTFALYDHVPRDVITLIAQLLKTKASHRACKSRPLIL